MKTIHLMTVSLASLLMASCSQNEVTEVSPDAHPQMTFAAYTGTSTRGTDTTNESMKAAPSTEQSDSYGGFGVMGYHTGTSNWETAKLTATPGFMHNQLVKWDATSGSGKWTYSPVKYWPNNLNDKISFFAYAPYESSWSDGANVGVTVSAANVQGIPYIDFKLREEQDLQKMVDLVVAKQTDMSYTADNGGKISFQFEHTLSRVSFQAKLGEGTSMSGDNFVYVYITEMWIVGKDHTQTGSNLSLLNPSASANTASKFYTKAKWSELHWNYDDTNIPAADFNLKKMLNVDAGITESNPIGSGHDGSVTGVKVTSSNTPVSLFPQDQYLYLIPVRDNNATIDADNSGCENAGDVQIGFHYDIVSKDNQDNSKYIASHAEAVVKIPAKHLQRAKTYQYTLVINLHEIIIEKAEVNAWGNEVTATPVE